MAAPAGNQFWRLRSKHGRDKLFSSPEVLWEEALEYFEWCNDNPLQSEEVYGKDAVRMIMKKMRAFTWTGLEFYLGISDLKNYRNDDSYKDFFPIITRIEQVIYTQKLEGAAAGLLNPNIIARDLQLKDTQAQELTGKNGGPIQHAATEIIVEL